MFVDEVSKRSQSTTTGQSAAERRRCWTYGRDTIHATHATLAGSDCGWKKVDENSRAMLFNQFVSTTSSVLPLRIKCYENAGTPEDAETRSPIMLWHFPLDHF